MDNSLDWALFNIVSGRITSDALCFDCVFFIPKSDALVKLGRSVRFVCNVNVVNESFVWCR